MVFSAAPPPYLPHLDGLRFVALLGVLLFHFGVPHSTGGFIGVDVFLALSGFLISRNILHALPAFSLRTFYVRRFYRLYPASLATVAATLTAAFLAFPPDLARSALKSAAASLLLASNLHFFAESGYFDEDAALKPLLHTWSLSLEEQFYFFWPFLLTLLVSATAARPALRAPLLLLVAAASFAPAVLLHPRHASLTFFLLPFRAYEFAVGALFAVLEPHWTPPAAPSVLRSVADNVLALASLLAVLAAFVLVPENNSPTHALPVLAATVALIATPSSLVARYALANRPVRFLGNLTYSAYLTHWGIYVFASYFSSGLRVPMVSVPTLLAATFVSAWLLRTLVEDPLRKNRVRHCVPLAIGLIATAAFCALGLATNGWDFRLSEEDKMDVRRAVVVTFRDMCVDPPYVKRRDFLNNYSDCCLVGDTSKKTPNAVIMGDSYARHLIPAFNRIGRDRGVSFMFNFKTSCPLISMRDDADIGTKDAFCQELHVRRWKMLRGEKVADVEPIPPNSTIIVASFGEFADMEARRRRLVFLAEDLKALGHRYMAAGEPSGMHMDEHWRFACMDLEKSPLVQLGRLLRSRKQSSCLSEWMKPSSRSLQDWKDYKTLLAAEMPDTPFLDMYAPVCKDGEDGEPICRLLGDRNTTEGKLNLGYGRDANHLTIQGSEFLSRFFEKDLPLD